MALSGRLGFSVTGGGRGAGSGSGGGGGGGGLSSIKPNKEQISTFRLDWITSDLSLH